MKDILVKTSAEVLEFMRTAVESETPEQITGRITDLKAATQEAGTEVTYRKYVCGVEISSGAFTKFAEKHPAILAKHPADKIEYPKVTIKEDGTVEHSTISRYVNTVPVGQGEIPLGEITDEVALLTMAKLVDADRDAIEAAQSKIDNADTAGAIRGAMAEFAALKIKLLSEYRIPSNLYVTRATMNTSFVAKAEKKLEEAIATQKFLQHKAAALKCILAEKTANRHFNRAIKSADNWMTAEGVAIVKEALDE